jgi:HEAT repeat protein
VRDAALKLAGDPDGEIRLALHSQLGRLPERRAESLAALWVFAKDKAHPLAPRAREALARLGERTVLPLLERDLKDGSAAVRLGALDALIALDASPRAATLLADSDASVRAKAACALGN